MGRRGQNAPRGCQGLSGAVRGCRQELSGALAGALSGAAGRGGTPMRAVRGCQGAVVRGCQGLSGAVRGAARGGTPMSTVETSMPASVRASRSQLATCVNVSLDAMSYTSSAPAAPR